MLVMWACASLMSRRNAAASSWVPCFSSQLIWLIIFSRTTHKARISASACAASRSPNTERVSHLPVKNVGQLPTFLRKSHPTLSKSSPAGQRFCSSSHIETGPIAGV